MKDHIYMPNEIFNDFRNSIKSAKHNTFAYSYYYYVSYLYRYCKWYDNEKITQALIKQKLQKSSIDKKVDYLIKKGGLLDEIGYTITESNYPLSWSMENGFLEFEMVKDFRELVGCNTIIQDLNFKVKYPVKSFFRNTDSATNEILDGTFYEVDNTHKIDYEVFEKCMSSEDLGTNAFYIYGYIKHKQGTYAQYKMASRQIKEKLIMSEPTFRKYSDALELHGLIKVHRETFTGKSGEANGYSIIS